MENLICMERSQPKQRLVLSDGALWALVLVGVMAVVLLSYDLSARFLLPRVWVQLALYAILCILCYRIYRKRLLSFRYTLTDCRLQVDRLVGNKARPELELNFTQILELRSTRETEKGAPKLYAGAPSEKIYIKYRCSAGERSILFAPSDAFLKELQSRWQISQS